MLKLTCDICGIRPANKFLIVHQHPFHVLSPEHFKVKKEIETAKIDNGFIFPEREWVSVDVCENCYRKILNEYCQKRRTI